MISMLVQLQYLNNHEHDWRLVAFCSGYILTDLTHNIRGYLIKTRTILFTISPVPEKQLWWLWVNKSPDLDSLVQ